MYQPESMWDRNDLARRLCHVLDISARTIELLAQQGYTDAEDSRLSVQPEKVIAETSLLLLVASSTGEDFEEVRLRVDRIAQLLAPHARSERILLGMCSRPFLAFEYAHAHICLNLLGYPDAAFDELLRQSIAAQAHAGRERPPHRMLEQEWIARLWMGRHPVPSDATPAMALHTVLNQPMDLLHGTNEDVYAFTHAIMYVTDFNVQPQCLPRQRESILHDAEAALARCLDEQDYDLGGEVLLAWPLTGKTWSAAAAFAFRVLARMEDESGMLPSGSTRPARLQSQIGEERERYLLATGYHTAYVMGLLCAAALQPGAAPPSGICTDDIAPGSSQAILPFLDNDGLKVHWRKDFDRLSDAERDALGGMLLAIALRRKVQKRDLAAVHKLLEIGYALGLAATPIASQSAEMLERAATATEILRQRNITALPALPPEIAPPVRATTEFSSVQPGGVARPAIASPNPA